MFNLIPKKKNETDIVETINKIFQEVEIKLDDSIYSNESKNEIDEIDNSISRKKCKCNEYLRYLCFYN